MATKSPVQQRRAPPISAAGRTSTVSNLVSRFAEIQSAAKKNIVPQSSPRAVPVVPGGVKSTLAKYASISKISAETTAPSTTYKKPEPNAPSTTSKKPELTTSAKRTAAGPAPPLKRSGSSSMVMPGELKDEDYLKLDPVTQKIIRDLGRKWTRDFGKLELGDEIGEGGFAEVYAGKYGGEVIAVKKLKVHLLGEEAINEFKKETAMMSKLDNEYIVKLTGVIVYPCYFMLVEMMEQGCLDDILSDSDRKIDWKTRISWAKDIAHALNYLHSRNPKIVHRDLKCENILVDKSGRAKLSDFGLSVEVKSTGFIAPKDPGLPVSGTFPFIPPECLNGKPANEKVDQYGFAICLLHVCTGVRPWADLSRAEIEKIEEERTVWKPTISPSFSKSCAKLIQSLWHDKPEERPSWDTVIATLTKIENE